MRVRSFAKINWTLRILGRREDGYHDLETIFQSISLHDTLTIEPAVSFTLTCDDPGVPTGETNLALRAAVRMSQRLGTPPVAIHIAKRIPAGGGLGGGSSNAAMILLGINRLVDSPAEPGQLSDLALELGSDVPFFLVGGTAHATGRGEKLTPLPAIAPVSLLLLLPSERVPTLEAFRRYRELESPPRRLDHAPSYWLDRVDPRKTPDELVNDLELAVFPGRPALPALKKRLRDAGATWSGMSGSGSTIVGAFSSAELRDRASNSFGDVPHARSETISREEALADVTDRTED